MVDYYLSDELITSVERVRNVDDYDLPEPWGYADNISSGVIIHTSHRPLSLFCGSCGCIYSKVVVECLGGEYEGADVEDTVGEVVKRVTPNLDSYIGLTIELESGTRIEAWARNGCFEYERSYRCHPIYVSWGEERVNVMR